MTAAISWCLQKVSKKPAIYERVFSLAHPPHCWFLHFKAVSSLTAFHGPLPHRTKTFCIHLYFWHSKPSMNDLQLKKCQNLPSDHFSVPFVNYERQQVIIPTHPLCALPNLTHIWYLTFWFCFFKLRRFVQQVSHTHSILLIILVALSVTFLFLVIPFLKQEN